MNNKAFRNLFCNPLKSFHTSRLKIIEAVNHSSNSTKAFRLLDWRLFPWAREHLWGPLKSFNLKDHGPKRPFEICAYSKHCAYSYTYVFFVIPIILRVWWGLVALFCMSYLPHQTQVQVNKNIKKKRKKEKKIAFTNNFTSSRNFSSKCYNCWVWRMVDSLYYSSWKIPERYENSFVDYRINYQTEQITKDFRTQPMYIDYDRDINITLVICGSCEP